MPGEIQLDTALGWQDDGTESGLLRTKVVQSDLAMVPCIDKNFLLVPLGTGTIQFLTTFREENPDGSGTAMLFTVPNGLGNAASFQAIVYGRVVGVRWKRDSTACPFSVQIDGLSYSNAGVPFFNGQAWPAGSFDEAGLWIVADNLSDGPHSVTVAVTADPTVTRNLQFHGWLLERRAGYVPPPRSGSFNAPAVVPTVAGSFTPNSGTPKQMRYLRKVFYTNVSGAPATITLQYSGTTFWQKVIAAGDTVEFDTGLMVGYDGSIKHLSSVASAITYSVVLGS